MVGRETARAALMARAVIGPVLVVGARKPFHDCRVGRARPSVWDAIFRRSVRHLGAGVVSPPLVRVVDRPAARSARVGRLAACEYGEDQGDDRGPCHADTESAASSTAFARPIA
jgi:hypothetical protein